MSAKLKRQHKIKELLNSKMISSHEQLIQLLKSEEIRITQATLSRDFAEMGVVRTFTNYGTRYVLSPEESGNQIARLIGFEILSVENNEALIVVRTLAGRAQGVAHFIDRLNKQEILGTVAGDDTVLIIPSSTTHMKKVIDFVNDLMTEKPGHKYK